MIPAWEAAGDSAMMGRQDRDLGQLFYEFSLAGHDIEIINRRCDLRATRLGKRNGQLERARRRTYDSAA